MKNVLYKFTENFFHKRLTKTVFCNERNFKKKITEKVFRNRMKNDFHS